MKITNFRKKVLVALMGAGLIGGGVAAAQVVQPAAQVSYRNYAYANQSAQPALSVNNPAPAAQASDCGCGAASYSDCGCNTGCNSGGCGLGGRIGGIQDRLACAPALGDAWTLFGRNCDDPWISIGGWVQGGYHEDSNGNNNLFNQDPDRFNLHQAWLYVEKEAKSECGELGLGFRFDGMYGTDSGDTQAFGNPGNAWDNGPAFDRNDGSYGWALPQTYLEVAKGDWRVKVGHFYTTIGYEVVTAPDNFFYSHAMTMYNSEPFTHTGVLASYEANDDMTLYAGWTLGWDTGFDQFGQANNFLGGFSRSMGEFATLTYMTTIGDFGDRGSDGYMQSIVVDTQLTCNVNYILQSDYLNVGSTGEDTFGINQYLIRTINDRLSVGTRLEWWKADTLTNYSPYNTSVVPASGNVSYWSLTNGFNYKLTPNLTIRPEYRQDWSEGANYDEEVMGVDMVLTY